MKHSKFIITGEAPVISFPCLIQAFGRSESELLQKIHYLIYHSTLAYAGENYRIHRKTHQKKKFIGLCYDGIAEIMASMSVSTVKRAVKRLRELGILIVEKLSTSVWERLNFYRIDYHRLNDVLGLNFFEQADDEHDIKNGENLNRNINKKIKVAKEREIIKTSVEMAVGEGEQEPQYLTAPSHILDKQPKEVRALYSMLRGYRVDIDLSHALFEHAERVNRDDIAKHILSRKSGLDGFTWHTPEHLQLDKFIWRV